MLEEAAQATQQELDEVDKMYEEPVTQKDLRDFGNKLKVSVLNFLKSQNCKFIQPFLSLTPPSL